MKFAEDIPIINDEDFVKKIKNIDGRYNKHNHSEFSFSASHICNNIMLA